MNVNDYVASNS